MKIQAIYIPHYNCIINLKSKRTCMKICQFLTINYHHWNHLYLAIFLFGKQFECMQFIILHINKYSSVPLTLNVPEELDLYGLCVYYVVHICDFGTVRVKFQHEKWRSFFFQSKFNDYILFSTQEVIKKNMAGDMAYCDTMLCLEQNSYNNLKGISRPKGKHEICRRDSTYYSRAIYRKWWQS